MLPQCKAALDAHYPAEEIAKTPAGKGKSQSVNARTPATARMPLSRTRGDHSVNHVNIITVHAESPVPMSVVKPMKSLNPNAAVFVMPQ